MNNTLTSQDITSALALFQGAAIGEVLEGPAPGELDRMRAWLDAYDIWQAGLAANSARAYSQAWQQFLAFTDRKFWEIGKVQVAQWVDSLRKQRLSDATIQQRVAAISSFYLYVINDYTIVRPDGSEFRLYEYNPAGARSLRPSVDPYGKAHFLTPEEAQALLRSIRQDTVKGLRDYALFLTYLATGRRNTEVRTLKWGAIDERGGRVYYKWSGKGKKDRKNELPLRVWETIKRYLREAGRLETMQAESYLFTALTDRVTRLGTVSREMWDPFAQPLSMREVGRLLKLYAKRAGLDPQKVHVHTLRHTAATLRKLAGDDIEQLCAYLGHSTLSVTQIYLHTLEGQKDTSWSKVEALLGL